MENPNPKEKILGQPVFNVCFYKDYLLVAAGGGGAKVGLRNKIICFKYDGVSFKDEVHSEEIKDGIPVCIDSLEEKNLFCAISNNLTYFYEIESHSGFFFEIAKYETAEFFDEDFYQNICRIDKKNLHLYTGTTDGKIKIWKINFENNVPSTQFYKDLQAHSKLVNDILVLNEKNFLITASMDGNCRIFDLKTLNVLKSLNFRENEKSDNLTMRSLLYVPNSSYLYTLQAPLRRGYSYITVWDMKNNFDPIMSKPIYEGQCGYVAYDEKSTLAIGCGDGSVVWADSSSLDVYKVEEKHGFGIKAMKFKKNTLLTGSPDFRLLINTIPSKGWLFTVIKILVYLSLVVLFAAIVLGNKISNQ